MKRILVCGGRDFADDRRLRLVLDQFVRRYGPVLVIHGAARGADTLADRWARDRGFKAIPFPARWHDLSQPGRRIRRDRAGRDYDANAGLRRNVQMLNEGKPDIVIAFPGGAGTAHMVDRAKHQGFLVIEVPARGSVPELEPSLAELLG